MAPESKTPKSPKLLSVSRATSDLTRRLSDSVSTRVSQTASSIRGNPGSKSDRKLGYGVEPPRLEWYLGFDPLAIATGTTIASTRSASDTASPMSPQDPASLDSQPQASGSVAATPVPQPLPPCEKCRKKIPMEDAVYYRCTFRNSQADNSCYKTLCKHCLWDSVKGVHKDRECEEELKRQNLKIEKGKYVQA